MNICLVSREYPPVGGGIATYIAILSRRLASAGHTVHVLTAEHGDCPPEERQGNVWIHRLPFIQVVNGNWLLDDRMAALNLRHLADTRDLTQVFAWGVARALRTLIPQYAIDVVEGPEYEAPLYLAQVQRLVDSTFPRVPLVVFLHSASYVVLEQNRSDVYTRLMVHRRHYEQLTVQMADAVVSPSRVLAARMESDCGVAPGTVRVIRLPVDGPPAGEAAVARSESRVLSVGTLCFLKGTDLAFDAVRALHAENPALQVRFIGQNPPNDTTGTGIIETLCERLAPGEEAVAEFVPPQPRERLWAEYRAAACLLSPARWENFPYVVTEAMACGCPIIGSRHTGIGELIEDGVQGFLVDATVADTRAGLQRFLALTPEARRAMGDAARARAVSLTNPDAVIQERVAHYAEVIQRGAWRAELLPTALFGGATVVDTAPARADPGPSVAVVVVCREHGAQVHEAVRSVRASTRPALEVVVVDDGSTDAATVDMLATLERDGAARVVRQARLGAAAARNRGLRETHAEALVFLDADDALEPETLARAAAALGRFPQAAAVGSWVRRTGEVQTLWTPPLTTLPFLLFENTVSAAALVRRAVLEAMGGYREDLLYGYEDWDLWIRCVAAGRPILLLPESGLRQRVRVGSRLLQVSPAQHGYMRRLMLEPHAALVARHALELVLTVEQFYVHGRPLHRVEWSEATAQALALLGAARGLWRQPGRLLREGPGLARALWRTGWRLCRRPKPVDTRLQRI